MDAIIGEFEPGLGELFEVGDDSGMVLCPSDQRLLGARDLQGRTELVVRVIIVAVGIQSEAEVKQQKCGFRITAFEFAQEVERRLDLLLLIVEEKDCRLEVS